MVLYITSILGAMVICTLLNIFLGSAHFGYTVWEVILMVTVCTVFQIAVDGLFAFIVNKCLPNKWFSHENKHFKVSKRTQKFYEKLKIRKWKDKVLELGALGGFRKNKLADPNNIEYIERFLLEINKGVVTHRLGYFFGFLDIFLFPLKYALVIAVPIAIVNLILSAMPTMVLRYNYPKLLAVHKRLSRNNEKEKINQAD